MLSLLHKNSSSGAKQFPSPLPSTSPTVISTHLILMIPFLMMYLVFSLIRLFSSNYQHAQCSRIPITRGASIIPAAVSTVSTLVTIMPTSGPIFKLPIYIHHLIQASRNTSKHHQSSHLGTSHDTAPSVLGTPQKERIDSILRKRHFSTPTMQGKLAVKLAVQVFFGEKVCPEVR